MSFLSVLYSSDVRKIATAWNVYNMYDFQRFPDENDVKVRFVQAVFEASNAKEYCLGLAACIGVDAESFAALKAYKPVSMSTFLESWKKEGLPPSIGQILVYEALKATSGKENDAVGKLADAFDIAAANVKDIAAHVESESKTREKRLALLFPKGSEFWGASSSSASKAPEADAESKHSSSSSVDVAQAMEEHVLREAFGFTNKGKIHDNDASDSWKLTCNKMLLEVIVADAQASAAERFYVLGRACALGVSQSALHDLLAYKSVGLDKFPLGEGKIAEEIARGGGLPAIVYEAFLAATADGVLDRQEKAAIDSLAQKLGLDSKMVQQIQDHVASELQERAQRVQLLFPRGGSLWSDVATDVSSLFSLHQHYGFGALPKPGEGWQVPFHELLLEVIAADGESRAAELNYVLGHAAAVGLSVSEFEALKSYKRIGARTYAEKNLVDKLVPVASTGARALVYECYKAANADGMLHAKETGAIDQVAKALGVDATTQHALQALVKAEHHLRMRVLSLLFPHSPSHTAADGFNFGHGALFWSAKGTTRVLLKLEELTAAAAAGNIGGAGSAASGGTDAAAAAGASAPESKASDKGEEDGSECTDYRNLDVVSARALFTLYSDFGFDRVAAVADDKWKVAFTKALLEACSTAGALSPREKAYILGRAAACGVSQAVWRRLFSYKPVGADVFVKQTLGADAQVEGLAAAIIYEACRAAYSDEQFSIAEKASIEKLAHALHPGFSSVLNKRLPAIESIVKEEFQLREKRLAMLFPDGSKFWISK